MPLLPLRVDEKSDAVQSIAPSNDLAQEIIAANLGGISIHLIFNPDYPTNVITKSFYAKLRNYKEFKVLTGNRVEAKIGSFKFCGEFTAMLTINNKAKLCSFYVEEGTEEFVYITKQCAKMFGISQ